MTLAALAAFTEIWLVDFEYGQPDGDTPIVKCMVGHELLRPYHPLVPRRT